MYELKMIYHKNNYIINQLHNLVNTSAMSSPSLKVKAENIVASELGARAVLP